MKLVRDYIPTIIEESGKSCTYHSADLNELRYRLYDKMIEELDEFKESPCPEEAADMFEVFKTICWVHNISMADVEMAARNKSNRKGGFTSGVILEDVNDESR